MRKNHNMAHQVERNDFEYNSNMDFIGHLLLDPTMPVSRVQCYGCGGHLQCADPGLPGYLPSELMRGQHDSVLRVSWFAPGAIL